MTHHRHRQAKETTMPRYNIYADGIAEAPYEAESEEAAILLYVQDAGYADVAAAADACCQSVEDFRRDIHINKAVETRPTDDPLAKAVRQNSAAGIVRALRNGR
jgi:hypothetical protein